MFVAECGFAFAGCVCRLARCAEQSLFGAVCETECKTVVLVEINRILGAEHKVKVAHLNLVLEDAVARGAELCVSLVKQRAEEIRYVCAYGKAFEWATGDTHIKFAEVAGALSGVDTVVNLAAEGVAHRRVRQQTHRAAEIFAEGELHGGIVQTTGPALFAGTVSFGIGLAEPHRCYVKTYIEQKRERVDSGIRGWVHGVDLPAGVHCITDAAHSTLSRRNTVAQHTVAVARVRSECCVLRHGHTEGEHKRYSCDEPIFHL